MENRSLSSGEFAQEIQVSSCDIVGLELRVITNYTNYQLTNNLKLGEYALLCNPYDNRQECFMWNGDPNGFELLTKENKSHYKVVFCHKYQAYVHQGGLAPWTDNDDTIGIVFTGRDDSGGYTERLKFRLIKKS